MQYSELDVYFKRPFCMMVAGPSQCGKTWFTKELLEFCDLRIFPTPKRIIYCYKEWQNSFDKLKKSISNIEFYEGVNEEMLTNINSNDDAIVVLDDLMQECVDNKVILDLFTVSSHHKNISPIFLTQNLYCRGKHSRSISLNTHYLVLFKNPRDRTQVRTLGCQLYPEKFKAFLEAFSLATEKPFGKLIVDLKQETPEELRLRSIEPYTDCVSVFKI
jgi:hypothetical protein